mgnify:CR=1 FL=1
MRKTFNLKVSNKEPARQADSIKHEVKKYLKRERKKTLPEKVDFWDFDCRIGDNAEAAKVINVADINSNITKLLEADKDEFYLEILAKHGFKTGRIKAIGQK